MGIHGEVKASRFDAGQLAWLPDPTPENVRAYAQAMCASLVAADRGLACVGIEIVQDDGGKRAVVSAMRKNGTAVEHEDDDALSHRLAAWQEVLNDAARRCFRPRDWDSLEMTISISSLRPRTAPAGR